MSHVRLASILILLTVLSLSCEGDTDVYYPKGRNRSKLQKPTIDVIKDDSNESIKKIKSNLITNSNAASWLTEYGDNNKENKVVIKTNYGSIKIRLYNDTPLHRANFIMLAKRKYFDSTLFYRVIDNFMIQGGNSDDDELSSKMMAIGSYRIPNEIKVNHAHTKGAIAMAVSPEEQSFAKKSSSFNFYIVEGQKLSKTYLKEIDNRGIEITPQNRKKYLEVGGAPHLDGGYTVFGEVYQGWNTLSKIANVKTKEGDWPINPVYIKSIEVIN